MHVCFSQLLYFVRCCLQQFCFLKCLFFIHDPFVISRHISLVKYIPVRKRCRNNLNVDDEVKLAYWWKKDDDARKTHLILSRDSDKAIHKGSTMSSSDVQMDVFYKKMCTGLFYVWLITGFC